MQSSDMQSRFESYQEQLDNAKDLLSILSDFGLTPETVKIAFNNIVALTHCESVESGLQQIKSEFARLQEQEKTLQNSATVLATLQDNVDALNRQLDDARSQMALSHDRESQLQMSADELRNSVQEVSDQVDFLKVELCEVQAERNALVSDLSSAEKALANALARVDERTRQYNELKEFFEDERNIRQEMINELERNVESANIATSAAKEVTEWRLQ